MASHLFITHTYPPDSAAVGQHMADLAETLAARGHSVSVLTAMRGYNAPDSKFARTEMRSGVSIRRVSASSFGKKTMLHRIVSLIGFDIGAAWHMAIAKDVDVILFSTSPPLIGAVVRVIASLRRIPTVFWAMDLNPDQLLALGMIRERGIIARVLEGLNRFSLAGPKLVIALDRFMAARLAARGVIRGRMEIVPPWPPHRIDDAAPSDSAGAAFRDTHGLTDKFVVMYSGNHAIANPLITVLEAAVSMQSVDRLRFVFIGDGKGKADVDRYVREYSLANVMSLPYQPQEMLNESLSAADVHVVSMGNEMVGITHPCKIYGAMAVARPVLFLGPVLSHGGDIMREHDAGAALAHGDVGGVVAAIESWMEASPVYMRDIGERGRRAIEGGLSARAGTAKIAVLIEELLAGLRLQPSASAAASATAERNPATT